MKQVVGLPDSTGTRITSTAFARSQAASSGVIAVEQIRISAVSIKFSPTNAEWARSQSLQPLAGLHPPMPPSGSIFVQKPDQWTLARLRAIIDVRMGCLWWSHEFPKKIGIRD